MNLKNWKEDLQDPSTVHAICAIALSLGTLYVWDMVFVSEINLSFAAVHLGMAFRGILCRRYHTYEYISIMHDRAIRDIVLHIQAEKIANEENQ